MSATNLLQLLLQKHEDDRDQAQRALAAASARLDAAVAQRSVLLGYRRDCERRWQQRFMQGTPSELLQSYLGFMKRLADALHQQDYGIGQMEALKEQLRTALVQAETRVASVRRLMGIRAMRQRQLEVRQERRMHDEVAQQVHRRKSLEEGRALNTH